MSTTVKFVSVPSKILAASINSAAGTIQVSDIKGWDGNDLTAADFGDVLWAVLRDSTNTFMEIMKIDPATIGDAQITVIARGLDFSGGETEIPANKLTWIKNDTIVELGSNPPQLLNQTVCISGAQTIIDLKTFMTLPQCTAVPTDPADFVNKAYADSLSFFGAPNASTSAKGLVQIATQSQVDGRTTTGSSGAFLVPSMALFRSTLLSDYVVDTGAADAYAIAPTPVVTSYVTGQIFSFKAVYANTTISTLVVNALPAKTIVNSKGGALVSGDIAAGMIVMVEYDGTNMVMQTPVANAPTTVPTKRLGGTGADGALAISSGTTTIDLAGADLLVKNYTTFAITGTGKLAFSNPHANGTTIIIRSQGGFTLTSSQAPMIDCSGLGATGAPASTMNGGTGVAVASSNGTDGHGLGWISNKGLAMTTAVGTGGARPNSPYFRNTGIEYLLTKYANVVPGAGGSGGSSDPQSGNGGAGTPEGANGGRGGGALIMETSGAWNFITTGGISVAGLSGTNGMDVGTFSIMTGGGGGGGAGNFAALVGSITANTGTVTVTGGLGGNNPATVHGTGYGGGGGGSNSAGNDGTSSSTLNVKTGGDGATGIAVVTINTEYL